MSTKKVSKKTPLRTGSTDQEHTLQSIPIDRVMEDPRNERKTHHHLDDLAASIKMVGVVEPITVTPEGEHFKIVTGHRRYRAAKQAGLAVLEVVIRQPEDEHERRRKSLISNIQREDLNVVEMVDGLNALFEDGQQFRSQRELAEAIGKSETWVSDMLAINQLATPLQEKLRISEVRAPYDSVARIARVKDLKKQARLVDMVIAGVPTNAIRERLSEAKGQRPRKARVMVEIDGYVAAVSGPKAHNAHAKLLAATTALLDKVIAESALETEEEPPRPRHSAA